MLSIHASLADGLAVTLMWTDSRRPCAMSGGATQPGSVHLIYDERASVAGGVTGEESGAEPWIWD